MTRSHMFGFAAAIVFALVAAGMIGHAAQRRPLPPLLLTSLDGQPVESAALVREGSWLLIYVEPACGSCAAVLSAMSKDQYPGLAQRVTVIVGGATYEQARLLAEKSELADAQWVLNADGSARQALNMGQAPATFGIRGSTIEWTLIGVLRQSTEMTSVLVSWLQQPRP